MNWFIELIKFVLHIDKYLDGFVVNYGVGVYLILFGIVFLETGLVVTPFLPGDSLLFVAGTFAASGIMNVLALFFVFTTAAILGDTVNYWIGSYFGEKFFAKSRFFKKEHLERTKEFYKKHGGKTIILARFIPIIRTFAPFVAGIGKMDYARFLAYNIIGGVGWVAILLFAGYYFGAIPIIQNNLMVVTYAIIIISLLPAFIEFLKHVKKK
ncbi:DedA family protein [Candidatus Woesearchaeota archaeon]|nr:DedA family protein [Candidatus Woesearchaeota archaeon]